MSKLANYEQELKEIGKLDISRDYQIPEFLTDRLLGFIKEDAKVFTPYGNGKDHRDLIKFILKNTMPVNGKPILLDREVL